ncbi:vitamin K epoxide reductase family protein [Nannocystis radixulma]|uniref:Vitamin K epoxide reductase family protein n=1 Tax=Nannocystis radixulma TaxID=2995305 RepID=A0ABT5BEI5_9BACT|nr:vitamin K epoxide reductase family protein [Nannocystis radixulma]MDC0672010.1 vitamin K epoxide reductase family protein [Nannocystis radixulma]
MSTARLAVAGLHRQALLTCALLGLIGASVGGYLTVLKFRMAYTPCLGPHGGCQIGEMRCEDALGAAWSVVGGLPISAWGSAAYVCITVLAIGQIVRRGFLAGCAASLLWTLSLAVACISLVYAVYAFAILQSPCPFCLSLDGVALLLVAAAAVVRRLTDPREQFGLGIALRHRRASLIDAGFRLGMLLTIATGVQSLAYHGMRHTVSVRDGCPERVESSPLAPIRVGPADAPVIVAAYLDMSCSACKRKFKQLAQALRNNQFPRPVQLWIYHAPRHACDPAAFPAGFARSDDRARDDNACLAARAAECMEKLQPGAGFRLIGGLFALHDDRQPGQPLFTAERVGNRAVDLGMEIDPDDPDNPLFRCIDHDRSVLADITAHQRHAEQLDLMVPAIAVHAAKDGAIDPARPPYWLFANTPFDDLAMYVELQAAPPAPPK